MCIRVVLLLWMMFCCWPKRDSWWRRKRRVWLLVCRWWLCCVEEVVINHSAEERANKWESLLFNYRLHCFLIYLQIVQQIIPLATVGTSSFLFLTHTHTHNKDKVWMEIIQLSLRFCVAYVSVSFISRKLNEWMNEQQNDIQFNYSEIKRQVETIYILSHCSFEDIIFL